MMAMLAVRPVWSLILLLVLSLACLGVTVGLVVLVVTLTKRKSQSLPPAGAVPPVANAEGPAAARADAEFRKCPFCAELIRKEAVKCRFCGSEVAP
jgi:hypothetical protein